MMRFIFYESPEPPIGSLEMVCGLHSSYLFVSFVLAVPVILGHGRGVILKNLCSSNHPHERLDCTTKQYSYATACDLGRRHKDA